MTDTLQHIESMKSAVVIPLAQSAVSGGLMGLTAWGAFTWAGQEFTWGAALAIGAGSSCLAWFGSQNRWQAAREFALYGPPEIPPVEPETPLPALPQIAPLRVELTEDHGRRVKFIDLAGTPEQLKALALGVLNGRGLAVSSWTGSAGIFTRAEFERLRADLIDRGLLRWINNQPNQGAELTPAGRAIFRKLAE